MQLEKIKMIRTDENKYCAVREVKKRRRYHKEEEEEEEEEAMLDRERWGERGREGRVRSECLHHDQLIHACTLRYTQTPLTNAP